MNNDPFPLFPNLSQKQLGVIFGVSSHTIGRWLKEIGLRLPNGDPSPTAKLSRFVEYYSDGLTTFPVWVKEEVVPALEQAGHERPVLAKPTIAQPAPVVAANSITLAGPFSVRQESEDGWAIVGGDGIVSQWLRGRANAAFVADLLNLAHKCGKIHSANTGKDFLQNVGNS